MYKPLLQELQFKTKQQISMLGDGVNNGLPPFQIADTEATQQKNVDSRKYPVLNVRSPRSNYGSELSGTPRHLNSRSDEYITVVDGTTWKYWNGSTFVNMVTGLAAADANTVDFMGKTILVNGTDNKYWDGSTSGNVATMPDANFLTVDQNRIYAASKNNQNLYFSAARKYNDWTTADDSGIIVAETRDGEGATGLTRFSNHVVLFKEHSIHELFGTRPGNFTFRTLTDKIGCLSNRTIKEVKGRLYFLGAEGVYAYDGGVVPQLISYPSIQAYINRLDFNNKTKAAAGTDGERYYLSLPIDSGGKILLVYDTRINKWYVEDDINIIEFTEFNNILYGLTASGQIKKMIDPAAIESIEWEWISKPYNEGSLGMKKSWHRLFFIISLPVGSTLKCALSEDAEGTTFTDVFTFSASSDIQNQKIMIPLTIAQNTDWVRVKLYGTGACVVHQMEKQMKIRRETYA